jgi:hypothetical protein
MPTAISLLLPLLLLLAPLKGMTQENPVVQQEQATTPAREQQFLEQLERIGPYRYLYPLTQTAAWEETLWATALLEPKRPYIAKALADLLIEAMEPDLPAARAELVSLGMQVSIQLYLSDPYYFRTIGDRLRQIVARSPNAQWSVMALAALGQAELSPQETRYWMDTVSFRFAPGLEQGVAVALQDMQQQLEPLALPPLKELLNWQIAPQQAHIYVFCRPQREILCRAMLKDQQGHWVRRGQEGELWSVLLLSRSLHRLRWHFVRGDTPAGIYRVEGTMPRPEASEFRAYGQFPLLKVFLPFEPGIPGFAPDLEAYRALLPPSWRGYFPVEGTYWAGKLGRSLIRIHGSGENPALFAQLRGEWRKDNYNPTLGCLSAFEIYDGTGELIKADMPDILKTFQKAAGGEMTGYLIVVEIPSQSGQPVSSAEIEAAF